MTAPRVEPTVESIEHLDFAPPCQAKTLGCDGANPAAYLAVVRLCCPVEFYICPDCVARKIAVRRVWRCQTCKVDQLAIGVGWLGFVTLHPLKAL